MNRGLTNLKMDNDVEKEITLKEKQLEIDQDFANLKNLDDKKWVILSKFEEKNNVIKKWNQIKQNPSAYSSNEIFQLQSDILLDISYLLCRRSIKVSFGSRH